MTLQPGFAVPSVPAGDDLARYQAKEAAPWTLMDRPATRGRFQPTTMLIYGRRGTFKSFIMSALASMFRARYEKDGIPMDVASNYKLNVARYQYAQILDDLGQYPPWGQNLLLCVDEVQEVANARRSMSKHNLDFSGLLHKIRKRRIAIIMTCQKPGQLDQNVLYQVDIVVRCEAHWVPKSKGGGLAIVLHGHDFWGQWRHGPRHRYIPPAAKADDRVGFRFPQPWRVFGLYDTDAGVISSWWDSDRQAQAIDAEWAAKGYEERRPEPEQHVLFTPGEEAAESGADGHSPRKNTSSAKSMADLLDSAVREVSPAAFLEMASQFDPELTSSDVRGFLRSQGFVMPRTRENPTRMAVRQ